MVNVIEWSGFEPWLGTLCCVLQYFSCPRHFTFTVPLSTQMYKCVPVNLMLGVAMRWSSRGRGEILLVTSCFRNRDKSRPDGPFGFAPS